MIIIYSASLFIGIIDLFGAFSERGYGWKGEKGN